MKTKQITSFAMLLGILIVCQFLANYVSFGPVSITLSLIPIVTGSVLYGPWCGGFLGLAMGIIVLFAPSTLSLFFAYDAIGTILTCLLKSSLAGIIVGFVYKIFKKYEKKTLGIIICSILMPILNTGFFFVFCLFFFIPLIKDLAGEANVISYIIFGFIGFNFIIELAVNALLSPALIKVMKIYTKKEKNNV